MATPLTLDVLLAAQTQSQIKALLLANLNADGFPITDWSSGAVERTTIEAFALALRDLVGNLTPTITGGGFLNATPGAPPSQARSDWLTFLAAQLFNRQRTAATVTIQNETLTVQGGFGPYTISVGQLIFSSKAGRRYTNITGGTLDPAVNGGVLVVQIQSESPNDSTALPAGIANYVDGADTIQTLVTPLAGVTCTNSAPTFTPVTLIGNSTGTVTPSGSPTNSPTFNITCIVGGQVGAATFAYEMLPDHPGTLVPIGSPTTFTLPGGAIVTFANGATSQSFFGGDIFTFSSPGSPVIQQGRDVQSDASLIADCQAQWPSLADVPIADKFVLWAKAADAQVTKCKSSASLTIAGCANVVIAGQLGPLSGDVVSAVAAYINARLGVLDLVAVSSATPRYVAFAGLDGVNDPLIVVPFGMKADVQQNLDAAWTSYLAGIDIGGIVRLSMLERLAEEAGAIDFVNLGFLSANEYPSDGSYATLLNIQLGPGETATPAATSGGVPSTGITWVQQ